MSLIATGVSKIYTSGTREIRAVDDVNVVIAKGEVVAIVGPSGAGKSTLLHILGGLDEPTSGLVTIGGEDLYALNDRARSAVRGKRVGFVFQSYHLLPELTALENVALPALMQGARASGAKTEAYTRAAELLGLVGLGERTTHCPPQLSGGEAQRVGIARALMNGPDFLLCDEPTGNLDSATSASICDLLFGLQRTTGMALVIVTHESSLADRSRRTIRLKDGKVVL